MLFIVVNICKKYDNNNDYGWNKLNCLQTRSVDSYK